MLRVHLSTTFCRYCCWEKCPHFLLIFFLCDDVGAARVPGEHGERRLRASLAVNHHAVGDAFVEADRHVARIDRVGGQRRLLVRQIGGVFRPDDAELLAERFGISRMSLQPIGQRSRVRFCAIEGSPPIRSGCLLSRLGRVGCGRLGVGICIVRRHRIDFGLCQRKRRLGRRDLRVEVVMPSQK